MKHLERDLQIECVKLLRLILLPDVLWTAIDHASASPRARIMHSAMGVVAGISDIFIAWERRISLGVETNETLWMELKSSTGRLSPEQVEWSRRCQNIGHHFVVVRSVKDMVNALNQFNVPHRVAYDRQLKEAA